MNPVGPDLMDAVREAKERSTPPRRPLTGQKLEVYDTVRAAGGMTTLQMRRAMPHIDVTRRARELKEDGFFKEATKVRETASGKSVWLYEINQQED